MTDIYIDFEFLEDGKSIEPISVGMTCDEDAATYYAVNWDAPWEKIFQHEFLSRHVCPHLPLRPEVHGWWKPGQLSFYNCPPNGFIDQSNAQVKPRWVIANEVREFIRSYPHPVLWGDEPCYDHVALSWLYGPMAQKPEGLPFSTFNIRQELHGLGDPQIEIDTDGLREHHALDDAIATRMLHQAIKRYRREPSAKPHETRCCA